MTALKKILFAIALLLPAWGHLPGDSIAAEAIPRFVGVDYIELGKIADITKFRSSIGHDYSDDFESCRTMKHYYRPRTDVDWSAIKIFSPVDGTIATLYPEWAGTRIGISPTGYPDYHIDIFHVDPSGSPTVGDPVTAGQQIGTHIGYMTFSDISIWFSDSGSWRLLSYFDLMTDDLFSSYQARGIQTRSEMMITEAERDADPLECDGESYLSPEDPSDWVPIIYDRTDNGDYNGDGTSEIAIFRASSGLWGVRGVTRAYFGSSGDIPVSGDYNGDGTSEIAVFRRGSGLWSIRGVSRIYFGGTSDQPVPGDYNGDGSCDAAIFRESSGLWGIRGISRLYFGRSGDRPIPGVYGGDGTSAIAIFRSGLWAIRNISRLYFGNSSDRPVPAAYGGDGTSDIAIFRPASGLWAFRGGTRSYFGLTSDRPVPADYNGDLSDDIGIFRASSGLWSIKSITRTYMGTSGDIPVTR